MENKNQNNSWILSLNNFLAEKQPENEQIFRLGNGYVSQNGNFEEYFSGKTFPTTSVFGITKSANPEILSVLPDWTSMIVRLNAEAIDLAHCEIQNFHQELNMLEGFLERNFEIITPEKYHVEVSAQRFLSLSQNETGALKYTVKSVDFNGRISFTPVINGDFQQESEPEWNVLQTRTQQEVAHLWLQIRGTKLQVCEAMTYDLFKNNSRIKTNPTKIEKQKVAGFSVVTDMKNNDTVSINKYVAILDSQNHPYKELTEKACSLAMDAKNAGWNELLEENSLAWKSFWAGQEISTNEKDQTKIISHFKKLQPN